MELYSLVEKTLEKYRNEILMVEQRMSSFSFPTTSKTKVEYLLDVEPTVINSEVLGERPTHARGDWCASTHHVQARASR